MTKRVLDVGNCVPDHTAICSLVQGQFNAEVVQAHGPEDALAALRSDRFDLVLVNRKLDRDYSDGLEIIKQIKADNRLASIPVMLISNYADQQEIAAVAGAEPGFGKAELHQPETYQKLSRFLSNGAA